MKLSWSSLYNLVLALLTGGIAIFTFVVTPALFKSYGRDMASQIVGKLFPGYFFYTLVLAALAFILFFTVAGDQSRPPARISFLLLILALVISATVTFKIYPDAVKLKQQITSFEREAPDSPARKRFARLHAASMSLNLLLFADCVVLLQLGPALKK